MFHSRRPAALRLHPLVACIGLGLLVTSVCRAEDPEPPLGVNVLENTFKWRPNYVSDDMLKRMHRLGDRKHVTKLVERIRTKIPGVFFRTAFIVGFPGETDAMFEELKQFILDMEFDRVAVFLYSDEEGT